MPIEVTDGLEDSGGVMMPDGNGLRRDAVSL
jgi:hypothetical protein